MLAGGWMPRLLGYVLIVGGVGYVLQKMTTFLQHPPAGDESERWIAHARQTLASLTSEHDAGATHSERD